MNHSIVWSIAALSTILIALSLAPDPPTTTPQWAWTSLPIAGTPIVVPDTQCLWWWRPYTTTRRVTNATDG